MKIPPNPLPLDVREYERDHCGKLGYEAYVLSCRLCRLFSQTLRADPEWPRIYHAFARASRRFSRRLYRIA